MDEEMELGKEKDFLDGMKNFLDDMNELVLEFPEGLTNGEGIVIKLDGVDLYPNFIHLKMETGNNLVKATIGLDVRLMAKFGDLDFVFKNSLPKWKRLWYRFVYVYKLRKTKKEKVVMPSAYLLSFLP